MQYNTLSIVNKILLEVRLGRKERRRKSKDKDVGVEASKGRRPVLVEILSRKVLKFKPLNLLLSLSLDYLTW